MSSGQASAGGNSISYTLVGPALARFPAAWKAALAQEVAKVADTFHRQAQAAYSGTRFAATFTVASTWQSVTLTQTHDLFRVVEYPTRPHIIEPRNARVLRFVIGGRVIFTTRVRHPGTKGRAAIDPLFQQAAAAFGQALTKAGLKVLRGL
jgi:hypothetical protein